MKPKHHKVLIPNSVKIELREQSEYIALEQGNYCNAERWLDGITKAILSLEIFPERCAIAPENSYFTNAEIRHLIYKKSFRIIFTIQKNEVMILSVRHSARL